ESGLEAVHAGRVGLRGVLKTLGGIGGALGIFGDKLADSINLARGEAAPLRDCALHRRGEPERGGLGIDPSENLWVGSAECGGGLGPSAGDFGGLRGLAGVDLIALRLAGFRGGLERLGANAVTLETAVTMR